MIIGLAVGFVPTGAGGGGGILEVLLMREDGDDETAPSAAAQRHGNDEDETLEKHSPGSHAIQAANPARLTTLCNRA